MTPDREAQMREMFEKWKRAYAVNTAFALGESPSKDEIAKAAWDACARALEPKWLPIETAPKDGTQILLSNGSTVAQGWWWHEDPYVREQRDMAGVYIDQQELTDSTAGWIARAVCNPTPPTGCLYQNNPKQP